MRRGQRERADGAPGPDERTPPTRLAPAASTTPTRRLLAEINARLLSMRAAWDALDAASRGDRGGPTTVAAIWPAPAPPSDTGTGS